MTLIDAFITQTFASEELFKIGKNLKADVLNDFENFK